MGVNDAQDMLEAAQAECIRLEKYVDELKGMLSERDRKYVKDTDILFLARKAAERERDAALAVVEQAEVVANAVNARAIPIDGPKGGLAQIRALLAQSPASHVAQRTSHLEGIGKHLDGLARKSPASALAKVKADAWDEGADAGFDNAGLPTPQWAQNPYRAEADRIEQEAL